MASLALSVLSSTLQRRTTSQWPLPLWMTRRTASLRPSLAPPSQLLAVCAPPSVLLPTGTRH
eukprot:658174-Prymnesium_polylepis.1